MTDKIGKFRLQEAIDRTYEEFENLGENQKNVLSITLLARKYAPKTSQHVLDCLLEDKHLLYLEQKPGHLLIDGLTAAIGEVIGAAVLNKHNAVQSAKNAEAVKQQMLRDQLAGR